MAKRVLLVGQCAFDAPAIARNLNGAFGVKVIEAESADEATEELAEGGFDLVLVNRILDATGEDGVRLIRSIVEAGGGQGPACMLVSNYADAQDRAVEAGAVRGFGKNDLGPKGMIAAVEPVLGG